MNIPTLAKTRETIAPTPALTAWRFRRICLIRFASAFARSCSVISSKVSMVVTVGDSVAAVSDVGVPEGTMLQRLSVPAIVASEVGVAVC